jgi:hypothetical protein
MQSESNSGEEFQERQDARPCPLLEMSDRLCIADLAALADLNSTKNEQEAPPPRPLMMVNIVNVKTDEIRDYPVNMVNVVNMMNVKMVKIRINRDSLSNKRRCVFMAANKIGNRNHRVHIGSHRAGKRLAGFE